MGQTEKMEICVGTAGRPVSLTWVILDMPWWLVSQWQSAAFTSSGWKDEVMNCTVLSPSAPPTCRHPRQKTRNLGTRYSGQLPYLLVCNLLGDGQPVHRVEIGVDLVEEVEWSRVTLLDGKDDGQGHNSLLPPRQ